MVNKPAEITAAAFFSLHLFFKHLLFTSYIIIFLNKKLPHWEFFLFAKNYYYTCLHGGHDAPLNSSCETGIYSYACIVYSFDLWVDDHWSENEMNKNVCIKATGMKQFLFFYLFVLFAVCKFIAWRRTFVIPKLCTIASYVYQYMKRADSVNLEAMNDSRNF